LENNQASNLNPNPERTEQIPEQPTGPVSLPEQTKPQPQLPKTLTQTEQIEAAKPIENPEPTEAQQNAEVAEAQERKRHNLVLLEAALYVAGRPLDINELCSVLTTRSKKKAEQFMETLMSEYAASNTAIEILRLKDERYVMQVKAEFTPLIKRLVNRPLLSPGPLKTLSYIAYRQPITSKRVIEVRGQHAYGHVKLLKEMGLVATERSGRTMVLKTTDYFADYFGLTMDMTTMKRDLKRIFGEALKDEPQL
jgi:segregation and condensation protein B